MKKFLCFSFLCLISCFLFYSNGQSKVKNVTGQEILEQTIKYHDPNNMWNSYKGKLFEVTVFPSKYVVKETIEIDNENDFYLSTCFQDFGILKRGIEKGKSIFSLNDKPDIPDNIKNNWGISDEDIKIFSVEHHSHFGLPMVLKNSGMKLNKEVEIADFDGRKCYALKFIGDSDLVRNSFCEGERVLYIDMNDYAMRGEKNSNFIHAIFSGEIDINGIKVVHSKAFYTEEGEKLFSSLNFLATE